MQSLLPLAALMAAMLLGHGALAQQDEAGRRDVAPGPAASQPSSDVSATARSSATTRGEIQSVDRETRTLTLKDKEGRVWMLRAGAELRNFDELAKGSKVNVRYVEAVLLSIAKAGAVPKFKVNTDPSARPTPQPPPAQQSLEPAQVTGKVTEIDAKRDRLRINADNGEDLWLRARNRSDLSAVQEGDDVIVSYLEAVALRSER